MDHLWDGQSIGTVSKNREYLTEALTNRTVTYPFYSASATIVTILDGPKKLSPYYEDFFIPDGDIAKKT